jgi:hypothetical protein
VVGASGGNQNKENRGRNNDEKECGQPFHIFHGDYPAGSLTKS